MAATQTPTSDLLTALGPNPGLERLYDNVQAEVPNVGLAMIKLQAWNTIEEFFLRSTVQRQEIFWQMGPGINTVDFNPVDESWMVAWIMTYSGLTYGRIDPPSVLRDTIFPVPGVSRNGCAILALRPLDFNVELPSMLWVQWFDVILAGVLSRLYGQPSKPYSSPQLAQFYGRRFRSGIARARAEVDHQFTDGGGRWRFPYFAFGRRKN